jgi:hypothetical protein
MLGTGSWNSVINRPLERMDGFFLRKGTTDILAKKEGSQITAPKISYATCPLCEVI